MKSITSPSPSVLINNEYLPWSLISGYRFVDLLKNSGFISKLNPADINVRGCRRLNNAKNNAAVKRGSDGRINPRIALEGSRSDIKAFVLVSISTGIIHFLYCGYLDCIIFCTSIRKSKEFKCGENISSNSSKVKN
jgi:hypothetical protein